MHHGTHRFYAFAGLLAISPALYFVSANILKYELRILPNIEVIALPPVILLACIAVAIALNTRTLLTNRGAEMAHPENIQQRMMQHPANAMVLALALLLLTILLLYVTLENIA